MKILTNDYRSNMPGEPSIAHGGPANFARAFSGYATKRGHGWVGLIQGGHEGSRTDIKYRTKSGRRSYYECRLPNSQYRPFLNLPNPTDPRDWFAEEIRALRAFMLRIQPDVLFLNGYSIYAWLLMEAASLEGIPVVNQHAGIARMEFNQYKHLYSTVGRRAMLELERDIVDHAAIQVFLNEYSRDVFSKLVAPIPQRQSRIIPLPYDPEVARHAVRQAPRQVDVDRGLVVGCVARWDRIKNHQAILRLAQEARRQGLPWTFRSVTHIPNTSAQARFKSSYRRFIEVIPPMSRSDLKDFFRSVDVMMLPSHFDVSPTVVMEAALLGKRTLISPGVGWNSEYRTCGLGDWISDFSDPAEVVSQLRRLLRRRQTTRFRTFIRETHAPNLVFAAYLRAFHDVQSLCA